MKEYVLGFMFDKDHTEVLLQHKKSGWQKNKYNGIGGKVEPGECVTAAMIREANEETGLLLHDVDLTQVGSFTDQYHYIVHVFIGHTSQIYHVTDFNDNSEPNEVIDLESVHSHINCCYHVRTLLHLIDHQLKHPQYAKDFLLIEHDPNPESIYEQHKLMDRAMPMTNECFEMFIRHVEEEENNQGWMEAYMANMYIKAGINPIDFDDIEVELTEEDFMSGGQLLNPNYLVSTTETTGEDGLGTMGIVKTSMVTHMSKDGTVIYTDDGNSYRLEEEPDHLFEEVFEEFLASSDETTEYPKFNELIDKIYEGAVEDDGMHNWAGDMGKIGDRIELQPHTTCNWPGDRADLFSKVMNKAPEKLPSVIKKVYYDVDGGGWEDQELTKLVHKPFHEMSSQEFINYYYKTRNIL